MNVESRIPNGRGATDMQLYFSDYYGVDQRLLADFGAFDISVASDLPLFVDPFLLFHSDKPEYQALHDNIIQYLVFLRDRASVDLDIGLINSLYRFKEVKQNWLGFTLLGNEGHALGPKFAASLHAALGGLLAGFGHEELTRGSHLEKLVLIRAGVGRDSISDFSTNLIKEYLLEFTQEFAREHLDPDDCREFGVNRVRFNYDTQAWESGTYYLPELHDDFVLLTPVDILTRDETWISYSDMVEQFSRLPMSVPNEELRAQINNYFQSFLSEAPTKVERASAAEQTIARYPELLDYYIKSKEDAGDEAESVSAEKVDDTHKVFVQQLGRLVHDLEARTDFFEKSWSSYDEALDRAKSFKQYVENQDGYQLINRDGRPFSNEKEVQLFFGLAWCGSEFDLNREPNNGRGPVDFKVSYGSGDKSLIEFKLGSNKRLKHGLAKQVAVYESANETPHSVKVIVCYTVEHQQRVDGILEELGLLEAEDIVVIDARSDNKASASNA